MTTLGKPVETLVINVSCPWLKFMSNGGCEFCNLAVISKILRYGNRFIIVDRI